MNERVVITEFRESNRYGGMCVSKCSSELIFLVVSMTCLIWALSLFVFFSGVFFVGPVLTWLSLDV